jgi:hypothetical protein
MMKTKAIVLLMVMAIICTDASPSGRDPPKNYTRLLNEYNETSGSGQPSIAAPADGRQERYRDLRYRFTLNWEDTSLGISAELRKKWRKQLLRMSTEDFINASDHVSKRTTAVSEEIAPQQQQQHSYAYEPQTQQDQFTNNYWAQQGYQGYNTGPAHYPGQQYQYQGVQHPQEQASDHVSTPRPMTDKEKKKLQRRLAAQKKADEEAAQMQAAQQHITATHVRDQAEFYQGLDSSQYIHPGITNQFAPVDVQDYSGQGEGFMDLNRPAAEYPDNLQYGAGSWPWQGGSGSGSGSGYGGYGYQ